MANNLLTRLTENIAYIQQLGDNPNSDNGLSAAALKAWFDKGSLAIKSYLNNTLIPQIESKFSSVDAQIEEAGEKINEFMAGTGFVSSDGSVPMTGSLDMGSNSVTNVADPVNETDAVHKGYVDEQKADAVTEANTYTETKAAEANTYTETKVKAARPRNLLDNSDFTNPVNQRGSATYTGAGYTIDRWNINANIASLAVGTGCVTAAASSSANGFFRQPIESKLLFGKTLTFAVKVKGEDVIIASGTYPTSNPTSEVTVGSTLSTDVAVVISAQTNNAAVQIRVNSGKSVSLEWAALYEGEYTAETLPEYQPKGYGAELAECQRYYNVLKPKTILSGYCTGDALRFIAGLYIPKMRITPTITAGATQFVLRTISGYSPVAGSVGASCDSITISDVGAFYHLNLLFQGAIADNNTPCIGYILSGSVTLSADL